MRKTGREGSHHPALRLSEREGGQREQRSVLQILADFHVWSASHSAFKILNPISKPPHSSPPLLSFLPPSLSLSLSGSSYSPSLSRVIKQRAFLQERERHEERTEALVSCFPPTVAAACTHTRVYADSYTYALAAGYTHRHCTTPGSVKLRRDSFIGPQI